MCTVTYIPLLQENSFILTSNRDESEFRATSPPEIIMHNDVKLGFPKDKKAGGSWIAMSDTGRLCCILNGAFVKHKKQEFHTISRGSILVELASSNLSVYDFFTLKSLKNVEPFTLIIIDQHKGKINDFNEFIWDGNVKHFNKPEINRPYIWSSATLYNEKNRNERKKWFKNFIREYKNQISSETVLNFHTGSYTEDNSINVIMQGKNGLKTVSITQVIPNYDKLLMHYIDLLNHSSYALEI